MDKTHKLLSKLTDSTRELVEDMDAVSYEYESSHYEYVRLSEEEDFLTGPEDNGEFLAEDFEDGIEAASEYCKNVVGALSDFDRNLMKLIQLRGQLAEEIGIPIGGKEWVRFETYKM